MSTQENSLEAPIIQPSGPYISLCVKAHGKPFQTEGTAQCHVTWHLDHAYWNKLRKYKTVPVEGGWAIDVK